MVVRDFNSELSFETEFDDREDVKRENIFGWWGGER
jgi:hypothetical protein